MPETRVLSEPMVLGFACNKCSLGELSPSEALQLFDHFFRVLCKKEENVKHVVLKLVQWATPALAFLKAKYPKIKLVFNTRHPRSTAISNRKLEQRLITFSRTLSNLWTVAKKGKAHQFLFSLPSFHSVAWWNALRRDLGRIQVWDPLPKVLGTTIFYFWYPPIVAFLANRKDYSHLVLFEDLTENPTQTVRSLLKALDLPPEHLSRALQALEKDSQRGMYGGRGSSGERGLPPAWFQAFQETDKLFKIFKAPLSMNMTDEEWRKTFNCTKRAQIISAGIPAEHYSGEPMYTV